MRRGEERREEKRKRRKKKEERRKKIREEKRKSQKKESEERRCRCAKMSCGSGGSKSRLAKAAGAEPCGQMRDEKLHADAVVARSTFPSQNVQNTVTHHSRTTFGS